MPLLLVLMLISSAFLQGCSGNKPAQTTQTVTTVTQAETQPAEKETTAAETTAEQVKETTASSQKVPEAGSKNETTLETTKSKDQAAETTTAKDSSAETTKAKDTSAKDSGVTEDGEYSTKEEVAEYIYLFGHLPSNFITKKEAQNLGWQSNKGNLWKVAPGKSIGGDRFGNNEGLLPNVKNRKYFECDINFDGGYRGSERIIFSNDGEVYYTNDHYKSFEHLYGDDKY